MILLLTFVFCCLFHSSLVLETEKTYLIANGAGFVGYHTALRLAENSQVIVVDDLKRKSNNLKRLRAQELSGKRGISVYQGDICDIYLLTELFKRHQFEAVVYSPSTSDDVTQLLQLSTECVANMLEVLKKHKNTLLVFLSSDVVYPVSSLLSTVTVPPSTIEAALTQSSEEMVLTYCELYSVPVVVLRLFNVYGPWSDAGNVIHDMAEQVFNGVDVSLPFESSFERDFTYIDDAVEAVLLSLHTNHPRGCSDVHDIGTGKSVTMASVVNLLAASFDKEATMGDSISGPGLPAIIQADLTSSENNLNFNPLVTIKEGISKYVNWLMNSNMKLGDSTSKFIPDSELETSALNNYIKHKSEQYVDRVRNLRLSYEVYAEKHGYPVSKLFAPKTFTKHSGFTFNGGNDQKTRNLDELHYHCQMFDECMGYDTSGKIKGVLDPQSSWQRGSGAAAVYVANVDVCKAGVHKCYGNASCVSKEFGQFKCACPPGWKLYRDRDCIELYRKGKKTEAEIIEEITDRIDGLDWKSFAKSSEFYPFKGKTVKNEYLSYYPEAKGNVQLLKEACIGSYHCMGFTSDGVLMTNVDVRKWVADSSVTLYARDVDYCSVDEVLCRPGQRCRRVSPGNYACV